MISKACQVSLRDVNEENVRAICNLSVRQEQIDYVVSTSVAIAEAAYSTQDWLKAIYADDTPVGLAVVRKKSTNPRCSLWRLMVDARYQGLNFGSRAIDLLVQEIKDDPTIDEFLTSVVAGEHSPQKFYQRLGFELTGETFEGEAVMRLPLRTRT